MSYKFEKTYEDMDCDSKITVEVNSMHLKDIVTEFRNFLLASGYGEILIDKYIDLD